MSRLILLLSLLLMSSGWAKDAATADIAGEPAEGVTHTLQPLLESASQPLSIGDDTLSGIGGDALLDAARDSRFVLFGEPHFTHEGARLTRALINELGGTGYNVLALEMGPHTTALIQRESEAGAEMLSTFESLHPDSSAFLGAEPERQLLLLASRLNFQFWGLDQEFVLSGTRWLEWLAQRPGASSHRELLVPLIEDSRNGDRKFRENQDTSGVFLVSEHAGSSLPDLREAFAEDSEALEVIDALLESRQIYQLWGSGEVYQSNVQRIALMKRHFWQRWQQRNRPPRVIFKFGSNHMGRGRTPVDQFDLGNMAHELAVSLGERSLHIRLVGRSRQSREGTTPLNASEPDLAPLLDACPEQQWCLFDLTQLREDAFLGQRSLLSSGLRELAFSYDMLVLAPELTSSR